LAQLPNLINKIEDSGNISGQAGAAQALVPLGQDALPALDALLDAINTRHPVLIEYAGRAITAIGSPAFRKAVPVLFDIAYAGADDDPLQMVRRSAATALWPQVNLPGILKDNVDLMTSEDRKSFSIVLNNYFFMVDHAWNTVRTIGKLVQEMASWTEEELAPVWPGILYGITHEYSSGVMGGGNIPQNAVNLCGELKVKEGLDEVEQLLLLSPHKPWTTINIPRDAAKWYKVEAKNRLLPILLDIQANIVEHWGEYGARPDKDGGRLQETIDILSAITEPCPPLISVAQYLTKTAPIITNHPATGVSGDRATLNGQVTDTGHSFTKATIYYGENDGGNNKTNWANSIDMGGRFRTFSQEVTCLKPDTTYYYRCYAYNSEGEDWADNTESFTPQELYEEGFEAGDFSALDWTSYGDADWTVTSSQKNSGAYSAQAGSIEDEQTSTLTVTLDCISGDISFYRKVSSEGDYDYLKFYIDGAEQGTWSGEEDWAEVSFPVTAGRRTFEWAYSKDSSSSDGADTAWIDDITFPKECNLCQRTLTTSSTAGGSVATPGEGAYQYDHCTSVPVTATAAASYHLVNWTGTAVTAGKVADAGSASTSVTMDADYSLQANFAIDQHTLTTLSTAGGRVSTPGEGAFQYDPGTSVPVTASPATGYAFVNWTGTAVDAGKVVDPTSASTSVTVDGDYTLEANFTMQTDPPPLAPANLLAVVGDRQVSLDWDDNTELDLLGYNIYRSTNAGSGYRQIATGVTTSEYVDDTVTNEIAFYYVTTAVDLFGNESGYSNEASDGSWDGARDRSNRVVRYALEEGSGTIIANTGTGEAVADANLSEAGAWAGLGLTDSSSDCLDAGIGVVRATHDFGNINTNYTLAAWIRLNTDLPDEKARYVIVSTENPVPGNNDSGWNFGVERRQQSGEWRNILFFDLRFRDDVYSARDSQGRDDIVVEEGKEVFVAFVRDHGLTPPGEPEIPGNMMFYLYDPSTETSMANDSQSRQKATTFKNTRLGIGITPGTGNQEDPATQFNGLIDDVQIWDISLSEADLIKLATQGGNLYQPGCVPDELTRAEADLNSDCVVDYRDLEIMAGDWLAGDPGLAADLNVDDTVDFKDYAVLADQWLEEQTGQ
jgi:hypothetical protein